MMSSFGKKVTTPASRRVAVRREVGVIGSVVTIQGSKSVMIEDLCPDGAKLLGRHLPDVGEEILLRTSELSFFGKIAWAKREYRGVAFEDGERPSAGACLAMQLRRTG